MMYLSRVFKLFILAMAFMQEVRAQDVCDTTSCLVAKAGRYKIELEKKCGDRLNFYIHSPADLLMENTEIIGYVDFFYLDDSFFIEEIYRYRGTNKLEVPVPYP